MLDSVAASGVSPAERAAAAAAVVADFDSRAERISMPINGGHIVWRIWGKGRPIILVHGGGGSWTHWIRNIDALAATRRVIVPDLPGCGDSQVGRPPDDPTTLALMLREALSGVVDSAEKLDFVTFSFGGIVSCYLAALAPDVIGSLVLVAPVGLGVNRQRPQIRKLSRTLPPAERREAVRSNLELMMIADPGRVDDLAIYLHDRNAARTRLKSSAISATNPLVGALPRLQCPIRAIWGSQDNLYPRDTQERVALFAGLRYPTAPIFIDPGGHWVQFEQADAFNRCIAELTQTEND
jgi:pimeloyl-ACP methyl ester carboxylesterase